MQMGGKEKRFLAHVCITLMHRAVYGSQFLVLSRSRFKYSPTHHSAKIFGKISFQDFQVDDIIIILASCSSFNWWNEKHALKNCLLWRSAKNLQYIPVLEVDGKELDQSEALSQPTYIVPYRYHKWWIQNSWALTEIFILSDVADIQAFNQQTLTQSQMCPSLEHINPNF